MRWQKRSHTLSELQTRGVTTCYYRFFCGRYGFTADYRLIGFRPETPDEKLKVSDLESGDFSHVKEIEGLRGGVHRYATQAKPKIDDAKGKKHPFRTETNWILINNEECCAGCRQWSKA